MELHRKSPQKGAKKYTKVLVSPSWSNFTEFSKKPEKEEIPASAVTFTWTHNHVEPPRNDAPMGTSLRGTIKPDLNSY